MVIPLPANQDLTPMLIIRRNCPPTAIPLLPNQDLTAMLVCLTMLYFEPMLSLCAKFHILVPIYFIVKHTALAIDCHHGSDIFSISISKS